MAARRDPGQRPRTPDDVGQGSWSTAKVALVPMVSLAVVADGVALGVALTGRDIGGDSATAPTESAQPPETTQTRPTDPVATTPVEPIATTEAPTPSSPATTAPEPQAPEDGQESGAEDQPQGLEPEVEDELEVDAVDDPETGTEVGEPEIGTEEEPETGTVEDPEAGSEGGEPEYEPQEPAEVEEVDVPDPVLPNQAYMAHKEEVSAFLEECGYWDGDRGGYKQCEDAEDTQTFTQMTSDFLGCEFNANRGLCEGMTLSEHWQLESRLACAEGWSLSESYSKEGEYVGDMCYRHDHPDYQPL